MPSILWSILGGSILTVGDIIFKFWIEKPQSWMYPTGLVIYVLGLMCMVESFKTQNIAAASTVFVIVNVVTLSLFSWFYFDQKLSPLGILGIIIAFVAMILLELK